MNSVLAAEVSGRLTLMSAQECLQRSRPEVMALRTLVGLDYDVTEQALVSTLERLADWILNLVDPAAPDQGSLLGAALRCGIAALQRPLRENTAALNLVVGLEALLHHVSDALQCVTVTAAQGACSHPWGIYSSSLAGWGRAYQCHHVDWVVHARFNAHAVNRALFAGRVLSGATLAFLEQHAASRVAKLLLTGTDDCLDYWVERAGRGLTQRGIWNLHAPPGRVWLQGAACYLLWPLAGQDLMGEIATLKGAAPAGSPEHWLRDLIQAGCLVMAGHEAIMTVHHPQLNRSVSAVRLADRLEAALVECLR